MGRQYGALLSKELKEFYAAINADLQARGLGQEHIEGVQATFQTYMPEMKQLIEGMSETSGLSFEEHIMLDASFYILPDLVIEAAQAMASCSGIAVSSLGRPTESSICAQLGHHPSSYETLSSLYGACSFQSYLMEDCPSLM